MNIKSIVIMATLGIISLFFINMSFAVNTGKIKVETANLRETAEENAKILEQLSVNDKVEIVEKTGDWYQVKAKGMTGYVRQDLITVEGEVVENNPTTNNQTAEEANAKNENNEAETEKQPEVPVQEVEPKEETAKKEITIGKQKVAENTKLKIVPVINATDIIEVKKEEEVNVIEIINGWACVEAQTTKGWIRKERLQTPALDPEQPVAAKPEVPAQEPTINTPVTPVPEPQAVSKTQYVNSSSINLRKQANTTSEVLANLPVNTAVEVLEETNGWSKVKVSGKEGYILTSLLSDKKQQTARSASLPRTAATDQTQPAGTTGQTTEAQPAPASSKGASVVAYAKQFIGIKYTYGGSTPATGFDCSGFTSYVYRNFGISLPRTAGGQAGVGTAVSRNNLVAGDLILYSGHVAIYVGGGQVIHAPRTGKTVCIVPINQAASNYLGARRVL